MLNIRLAVPKSNLVTRCDFEDLTCDLVRCWCDFCGAQVCGNHVTYITSPHFESESFQTFIGLRACPRCAEVKPFDEEAERKELQKL